MKYDYCIRITFCVLQLLLSTLKLSLVFLALQAFLHAFRFCLNSSIVVVQSVVQSFSSEGFTTSI